LNNITLRNIVLLWLAWVLLMGLLAMLFAFNFWVA